MILNKIIAELKRKHEIDNPNQPSREVGRIQLQRDFFVCIRQILRIRLLNSLEIFSNIIVPKENEGHQGGVHAQDIEAFILYPNIDLNGEIARQDCLSDSPMRKYGGRERERDG